MTGQEENIIIAIVLSIGVVICGIIYIVAKVKEAGGQVNDILNRIEKDEL